MYQSLLKLINAKRGELPTTLVAFMYYFLLLFGYYILRPVRDTMGIEAGVEQLHWLFTATFITMLLIVPLFGYLTSRFSRRTFISASYSIVIASLLLFYVAITHEWSKVAIARAFYVWVSVFNLFIVSVFWSLMTDIFNPDSSKRLFPFIAAGGTSGAIIGPFITGTIVNTVGIANLLLLSSGLLALAIVCVLWLTRGDKNPQHAQHELGGSIFEAVKLVFSSKYLIGIALLVLLYSTTSTFLYFEQAYIVRDAITSSESKTALFAWMDFAVNVLTLLFQLTITARIIKRFGLTITLCILPAAVTLAFFGLSVAPALLTIVLIQTVRRAGNYAIMRPAREALYVILTPQEKYKAKNFIDTVVYRCGDVSSAWIYASITAIGFTLVPLALFGAGFSTLWLFVAYGLGRSYETKSKA